MATSKHINQSENRIYSYDIILPNARESREQGRRFPQFLIFVDFTATKKGGMLKYCKYIANLKTVVI